MLIIDPSHEIIVSTPDMEHVIERVARVCYKSEDKITETSHAAILKMLKAKGHEAMLEHASITVLFTTNRGVSHEIVRHRIASFAQESTRYVNYGDKGCVFIRPDWATPMLLGKWKLGYTGAPSNDWDDKMDLLKAIMVDVHDCSPDWCWLNQMDFSEGSYNRLLEKGWTPQQAREVLPNSTKTEIVVTTNVREWRHVFKLRALGTTGKPHPEMVRIMQPCLDEFKQRWPLLFGDLVLEMEDA